MKADKIKQFMELAGQTHSEEFRVGSPAERELGAKLLLSEVLEYVIKGLGVVPVIDGHEITDPEGLQYVAKTDEPNELEMLDGLADVAYTMYWNSSAFGVPLEDGFELVCDNNLDKFVKLNEQIEVLGTVSREEWHLNKEISWPNEVTTVEVLRVGGDLFAVGKDETGKVKKPSSYASVDLTHLISSK